ncbi:MAG TPA: ATP-binding protein [Mobilitalea sp.]|nr:ATP-binding protein [Mobilitalea sp.]
MFVKRTAELNQLAKQYETPGSNLVILYGRKGVGKTTLLRGFMKGKPACYYLGVECDDRMQIDHMNNQWNTPKEQDSAAISYQQLIRTLIKGQSQKTVIVLDEFHLIVKNGPGLLEVLPLIAKSSTPFMFVLCSSSIRFVENEMVGWMGELAANITSYLKLKEFSFVDFVNRFPKSSVETCIYVNALLGGVPDYLTRWREEQSVRNNIISVFMNKDSRLFHEPQYFLKQDLREPAVYNTILSSLAEGNRKLNDLHRHTGYSRAKIIVYIKNLMELDVVEKLVPLGDEGKENAKKGLYRIKDHFLHFWYRFVFPNISELQLGEAVKVYEEKVEPFMNNYMGEYFAEVCMEYLKLMNLHQRLPVVYQWWDRWYGKNGTIDIIARGQNDESLAGICIWEDRNCKVSDYDNLLELSREAGINPESIYLFSRNGFTKEIINLAKDMAEIHLVGLDDL